MRGNRRQRGYSLIEVLVAFAILAMTMTVIMRVLSAGLSSVGAGEQYVQAILLADSILATPGVTEPLVAGSTFEGNAGPFAWSREITRLSAPDDRHTVPVAAFRIAVRVEWPAPRGTRRITLDTVRLGPVDGTAEWAK